MSQAAAAVTQGTMRNVRWYICALLFFATVVNYVDRQVLGTLAPELQKTIGWSELDTATSSSPFRWLTQ